VAVIKRNLRAYSKPPETATAERPENVRGTDAPIGGIAKLWDLTKQIFGLWFRNK
jgi:hypothetical protein